MRSRISNFAGKSVNPRNRLRRLHRAKGGRARFFSGVKSSVAPRRERKISLFLFLPPLIVEESLRRYLTALPARVRPGKSGKAEREISQGEEGGPKKTEDYASSLEWRRNTHARRFRVHLSPSFLSRRRLRTLRPTLRYPLAWPRG